MQKKKYIDISKDYQEGFLIFNPETATIVEANAVTARILTGSDENSLALKGRKLTDFLRSVDEIQEMVKQVMEKGYFNACVFPVSTEAGEELFLETTSRRIPSEGEADSPWLIRCVIRDITEMARLHDQLREDRELFENVIDTTGDVMVAWDRNGHLLLLNCAARECFGYSYAEVEKTGWVNLIFQDVEKREEINSGLNNDVYTGKKVTWEECQVFTKAGSLLYFFVTAMPVRDKNGVIVAILLVMHDVSSRKEIAMELQVKNEEVNRANETLRTLDIMKTNLLSNVSHELRTPLVAIKGYNEMMLKEELGPVNSEQRHCIQIALKNVDRLVGLIDTLLTYSRIESGQESLAFDDFYLKSIIDEVKDSLILRMEEHGIRVETRYHDEKVMIRGDRDKCVQVFTNIMENAIKFNQENGRIYVETRESVHQMVTIEIRDTGIGISGNLLPRVTERFFQADASTTRKFGGTGIGLSLSEDIIRLHGGRLFIRSEKGEGTSVIFTLPREALFSARKMNASAPIVVRRPKEKKRTAVLVVDDDREIAEFIKVVLFDRDETVLELTSGDDLIDTLLFYPVKALLLDVSLPKRNGFDICRVIRENPSFKDLPVCMMSARHGKEVIDAGISCGADALIIKPFSEEILLEAIDVLDGGRTETLWVGKK